MISERGLIALLVGIMVASVAVIAGVVVLLAHLFGGC